MTGRAAYLRLGASLLAVAAAAAGIVVVVALVRSEPGPVGSAGGSGSGTGGAAAPAARPPSLPGGRIPTPTSPRFPSPPPGAIVRAREAGARALGLAVVPTKPKSLVRVSVVGPNGPGVAGLAVSVRLGGGAPVKLPACGAGCYQADVRGGATVRRAWVKLDRVSYSFELPGRGLPPDATGIVQHAAAVWRALKTVVWHERLASDATDALYTVYRAVAPDELSYTIRGGSAAVIIGARRWDRYTPTGRWTLSVQNPPIRQPQPFWTGVADARVLGAETLRGHRVWDVSFFDPGTPGWFEAWIDRSSGRTLELWMIATSHFMHHVYGQFDVPFVLHPPT